MLGKILTEKDQRRTYQPSTPSQNTNAEPAGPVSAGDNRAATEWQ